jgi:hypothetical protein
MNYVFEVTDKNQKKIRLTKSQWTHIRKKHPEVEKYELIEETIIKPDKMTDYDIDESVKYYYRHYKHRSSHEKYLQVVVK